MAAAAAAAAAAAHTTTTGGLGWGLREVEWVTELATAAGLVFVEAVPMPANNLTIVYSKPAAVPE